MRETLKAGVGRADITPPLGTILMGYAPPRPATNLLDSLTVTAMALTCGETKTILLSITTTIIDDPEVDRIREAVSAATGYDIYDITVSDWQVHSGPATQTCYGWDDRNDEYCRQYLEPGCVEAAKAAIADIGDVEIGIATTESFVAVNRRKVLEDGSVVLGDNPNGLIDPTMTVMRFRRDGKPYANIIHYGAHPTALGRTEDISRDWPGIMVDRVEEMAGGMTLFFNGAVGDVGPRVSAGYTTGGGIEGMREVGYRAAMDALRACKEVKGYCRMDLELVKEDIRVEYRPLASYEEAKRMRKECEANKDEPGMGMANYHYWQMVMDEYDNGTVTDARIRRQTITRIGPVVMVPFAGEPFAEIVMRLRQHSPFPHTLSLSTTNGSDGYIVTRDSLHRGGYEVEVAKAFSPYILAENIDDVLIRENLRLIRRMNPSGVQMW